MTREISLPFDSVLDALFADQQLPIHLLYRLSDLSPEEMGQFTSRWPDVPDERRRVIVRHLADISEENYVVDFLPIFVYCFQDQITDVRIAALDGVWDATNTSIIEPIIRLMQTDQNVEVRAAAAGALAHYILMAEWGELPRQVSTPIVAALLAEYDKPGIAQPVKRAALEALGAASHPRVGDLIEEAYETGDLQMQLSAVFAMGSSANTRWLPAILDEMESPYEEMRVEAARAAGTIGHTDSIPALGNLVLDEDLEVSLAAVTALGQVGGEAAYDILAGLADDPEFEQLHDAVDEAMEQIDWLGGQFNLLSINGDDTYDEEGDEPDEEWSWT